MSFEAYKPYHFTDITEGDMNVEDLFQTVIEAETEEACETAVNLINSAMYTNVIIRKLMRGDYDREDY